MFKEFSMTSYQTPTSILICVGLNPTFTIIIVLMQLQSSIEQHQSTFTCTYTYSNSNVSEMIIFLFLGVSLYDHTVQNWDWGLSLWTVFFSFIYRPIGKTCGYCRYYILPVFCCCFFPQGVIVLTLILNIFRVRKIGLKSVFVMVCPFN